MKKTLFLLFFIIGFSMFACPFSQSEAQNHITYMINNKGLTPQQATVTIKNLNDMMGSAVAAGMGIEQAGRLSQSIIRISQNPYRTTSNFRLTSGIVRAQQDATNRGLGSLNVISVNQSGSGDGLNISLHASNGNEQSTIQLNTSSSSPTYTTTDSTTTNVNSTIRGIVNSLYNSNSNSPIASSNIENTTGTQLSKSVRIIGGNRVTSNGGGNSVTTSGAFRTIISAQQ